jgi:hypothetical protein
MKTTRTQNLIAAALVCAPGGNAIAQEPGRLAPLPDTENVK